MDMNLVLDAELRVAIAEAKCEALEEEVASLNAKLQEESIKYAVLEGRILELSSRETIVIPEQKSIDISGLTADIAEVKALLMQCAEIPEPPPPEFDVVRGSDGRITKIKVR